MNGTGRQVGFSLVELMVSLVISAVVTLGVMQLFTANSESYRLLQGQSRMQESARFALNFIGQGVYKANYRGCFSNPAAMFTTLDEVNIPYEFDLRRGVEGFNGGIGANWLPSVNSLPTTVGGVDDNVFETGAGEGDGNGIDISAVIHGTDILTVRNVSLVDHRLAVQMPNSTEEITVVTPVDDFEFAVDYLAMIHDCEKATIFRITDLTVAVGESTIGHDIDDVDTTRNTILKLAEVNTFDNDASVSAIESNTFYIAPGSGVNEFGDAVLSLWRKSGIQAPIELVEGVEDLQILYGVDDDGDATPNRYTSANFVVDWGDVRTIRVTIVVNSVDDVGGTSNVGMPYACGAVLNTAGLSQGCIPGQAYDGLVRRAFTQTFKLRN